MRLKVASRILIGTLALSVPVVLFQNCGKFEASQSPSSVFAAKSAVAVTTPGVLQLVTDPSLILPGAPFTVSADLSGFAPGTEFMWDHDFSDGLTYCGLTTSVDKTTTSFSCPATGQVTITFTAYSSDGTSQPFSLVVRLSETAGGSTQNPSSNGTPIPIAQTATPTPTPVAVVSTPTPTPTPVMLSANAMFYNTTCSGCHGTLPNLTDKKGTTLAQLQTAISSQPAMAQFKATGTNPLSLTQEQNIIQALNQ